MSYPMTRYDTRAGHDDPTNPTDPTEFAEFAGLVERIGVDAPRLPLAAPVLDEAAAGEAARKAVAELVDRRAMDAVLARVKEDGLRLTGPGGFLSELVKAVLERGLQAELAEHLGYARHEAAGRGSGNSRNGSTAKTVQTEVGPIEVKVPRDRAGTFTPVMLPKNARRLGGLSDVIISLYAGGMTVRDISHHLHRVYGTEVGPDTISTITDEVLDEVKTWQQRPLDEVYPIVYIDALMVKVRDGGQVRNKACYLVVGVGVDGVKHVLGIWVAQSEGAKFWMQVCTELRNRGVRDVLIACCDGLNGLPEAVEAVWPHTTVQTCVVHYSDCGYAESRGRSGRSGVWAGEVGIRFRGCRGRRGVWSGGR